MAGAGPDMMANPLKRKFLQPAASSARRQLSTIRQQVQPPAEVRGEPPPGRQQPASAGASLSPVSLWSARLSLPQAPAHANPGMPPYFLPRPTEALFSLGGIIIHLLSTLFLRVYIFDPLQARAFDHAFTLPACPFWRGSWTTLLACSRSLLAFSRPTWPQG